MKMKTLLVIGLFFSCLTIFSNEIVFPIKTTTIYIPTHKNIFLGKNWKIEFQNSEIKIESAIVNLTQPKDGISHEIVIFRYTNLTQKNISLSFNRSSYYGNVCYGCDGKESQFKLDLKPGQALEYKEGERNKTFYLFSKDLKGTIKKELSKFEITNIVVQ